MMQELDLLKKDWKKNEHSFEQISEVDIYKMIHKKSSSIVKLILIISVLEVLLWTIIGILYNSDDYFIKTHSEYLIPYFKYLNYFNYAIVAVFIYLFYKNYKAISTITSTKQLMNDILKTRKTVQYYVWYQLGMMTISMIIGFVLVFTVDPNLHEITSKQNALIFMILFCGLCLVVFIGIFWLFYRLIYGILMRKLYRNYNELKKVDL